MSDDTYNRYGFTITFTDGRKPQTWWFETEAKRDRESGKIWDREENIKNVKDIER